MTQTDLSAPLILPVASAQMVQRLRQRRSAPAQSLSAPAPSPEQVQQILSIGARTPDHGKLFPWRFVVLGPNSRQDLGAKLAEMAQRQGRTDKDTKVLAKLANPPLTIMVVSAPIEGHKVPVWEQQLSAGAVCMNLEHAADALGFSASWITDWYAYDAEATALFGIKDGETIAGFIHIGTLIEGPLERPRPDMETKVEYRE